MKKVLVVDDDARMTELMREFLTESGYDVLTLNDSRSALLTAADWQPDLITLDLEMPYIDGIDLLQNLRANPLTKDTPVIIMSIVAADAPQVVKEKVQGVFKKPFHAREIIAFIRALLGPKPAKAA